MPGIFISYRRADSSAITGRIYDRLVSRYGKESVFLDIDSVPIAIDFRAQVQAVLQKADVTIAVIGREWKGADAAGSSRILEETDLVRVEIETALARPMPLVPVLVDGARMPASAELPNSLGQFPFLNAAEVATGRDFDVHMDRLMTVLDRLLPPRPAGAPATVAGEATVGGQPASPPAADTLPSRSKGWRTDLLRDLMVPLVLLLVAHHILVNLLDFNEIYLQSAAFAVPFPFGFLLAWRSGRGAAAAVAFAAALGVLGDACMAISASLYSGQPFMPENREDWRENVNYAVIIGVSFMVGHASVRALRAVLSRRLANTRTY
jgi:hypothetical protein